MSVSFYSYMNMRQLQCLFYIRVSKIGQLLVNKILQSRLAEDAGEWRIDCSDLGIVSINSAIDLQDLHIDIYIYTLKMKVYNGIHKMLDI